MKRFLDVVLTVVGLAVLGPVMLLIALAVRREFGPPVIFRQERTGLNGRAFVMFKFRSMTDERDEDGSLLPSHRRLTPFGRWLRATSLDELPELINVLRGDMSLVGPRPLLPRYLPHYTQRQAMRHTVRPGITGWAQVNGRNAVSWEQRLELDAWYVEHHTLALDARIMLATISKVLRRDGITPVNSETMLALDHPDRLASAQTEPPARCVASDERRSESTDSCAVVCGESARDGC